MKKKREPDVLELKERADTVETLRQRLASRRHKKGRTVDEFFREFFATNNISHGLHG